MFHSELLGLIHLDPAQEIFAPLLLVICMVYPVLEFVGAYTQKGPTITAQKRNQWMKSQQNKVIFQGIKSVS